jgi:biopolymer transport protein ExbD
MKRIAHSQIELQIAPMIDVCFLLLFFYPYLKPVKPEADMSATLPERCFRRKTWKFLTNSGSPFKKAVR